MTEPQQPVIPADVLEEIAVVIQHVVRDEFWRRGRYEHGYANGIISFARAVTKTGEPLKVLGPGVFYSEETAARTFETAALDLLRLFANRTDAPIDLREKARQLVEAWGINSLGTAQASAERKPATLKLDDREVTINNLREFWDCREIRAAAADTQDCRFVRFMIQDDTLCTLHIHADCTSSMRTRKIGALHDPSNILRLCRNKPSTT